MTPVDLLSDTSYRQQAIEQLNQLLGSREFPVKSSQIYGLRQIARQQPGHVKKFASHQQDRAQRRLDNASNNAQPKLQSEIEFWKLVHDLCDDRASGWFVCKEADSYIPVELRDENIPSRRQDMTHEERRQRNELKKRRREFMVQWQNDHIPAFFERFCTHCLYRLATRKEPREE